MSPVGCVGALCAACLSLCIVACSSGDDANRQSASPQTAYSYVHAQKGPFQTGSKVILYELDGYGQRTGRTSHSTIDEAGLFVAEAVWTGATEAKVTGYYFDESSAAFRTRPGTLTGWINLPSTKIQSVNLFTHFALARTRRLVADGKPASLAHVIAFNELRTLFNLQTEDPEALAYLDLCDGTGPLSVDNANLLLFSTALMAAGLQRDIDNLSNDIADDGIINGIAMESWIRIVVYAGIVDMALVKTRLETLPTVLEAPDFVTLGSVLPPWVDLAGDADNDGLSDRVELLVEGSDPLSPDTDNDSYTDGYESSRGGDPNDSLSLPLSITSLPDSDTETGFDYRYTPQTTWGGVTFSLDSAPPGMSIDSQSGVISWTPTLAQPGEFNISVRATSGSYSDIQSYVLTTTPGNTGDINEDGTIDGKDSLLGKRIVLGLMVPSSSQMIRADVVPDGRIQGNDIIRIQRLALGF